MSSKINYIKPPADTGNRLYKAAYDLPGKKSESFTITLDVDTWDGTSINLSKLQIMSLPKRLNYKWYHRLLNKLTFGYLCPTGWTYKVKTKDKE